MISTRDVLDWFVRASEDLHENREKLDELDALVGDGEHGSNISRAFLKVSAKADSLAPLSVKDALHQIGMILLSAGGGAAASLFAVGLLEGSKVLPQEESISDDSLVSFFERALESIKARGKAERGDKTLVDALEPAVTELRKEVSQGISLAGALKSAAAKALEGAELTKDMLGHRGRAFYSKERALGVADPGATSIAIILGALAKVVK